MSSIIKSSRLKIANDVPFVVKNELTNNDSNEDNQAYDALLTKQNELDALLKEIEKAKADLEKEKSKKKELIEECKLLKTQELENIQEELNQIRQETKKQAYDEGLANAKDTFEEEKASFLTNLETEKENFKKEKDEYVHSLKEKLKKIIADVITEVIHTKVSQDDSIIENLIVHALCEIGDEKEVRIILSETDLKNFDKESFLTNHDYDTKLSFNSDKKLKTGSCMVETSFGFIDASLDNLTEEICSIISKKIY